MGEVLKVATVQKLGHLSFVKGILDGPLGCVPRCHSHRTNQRINYVCFKVEKLDHKRVGGMAAGQENSGGSVE